MIVVNLDTYKWMIREGFIPKPKPLTKAEIKKRSVEIESTLAEGMNPDFLKYFATTVPKKGKL